jgi:polysaccharide biosynthesis/export protein
MGNKQGFKVSRIAALVACLLGGCAMSPGFHMDESRLQVSGRPGGAAPDNRTYEVTPVTAQVVAQQNALVVNDATVRDSHLLPTATTDYHYQIEPDDVINITVFNHPELAGASGSSGPAGSAMLEAAASHPGSAAANSAGYLVNKDGTFLFPFIGRVPAQGKTTSQVRDLLTRELTPYIRNPQIFVRVADYRSQKVSVAGEVKTPGILPITDVPMTAERALQMAGGAAPDADLHNVTLIRAGKTYPLDLQALYENGSLSQNILLKDGDTLQVADRSQNKVFVLGEVNKSGAYQMIKGRMTLADALGESGGFNGSSDPRKIYVIRGQLSNPSIFKLDGSSPTAMLMASQFQLRPKDVVYVAPSEITRFGRVIEQILPSLSGIMLGTQLH